MTIFIVVNIKELSKTHYMIYYSIPLETMELITNVRSAFSRSSMKYVKLMKKSMKTP